MADKDPPKITEREAILHLLGNLLGLKGIFLEVKVVEREKALDRLREEVYRCEKCPLHKTKTRYVFGEGNPYSDLMLVGEAPGRDEDLSGKPFVGRAGQLLTSTLQKLGVDRIEETYIANVLKCRPPQNRDPNPSEIEACTPYLEAQIKLISPKVIVAMGRFAAQFLLGERRGIRDLRGKVHQSRFDIPVVVTYHPAALLRNPNLLGSFLQDLKMAVELRDK